MGCRRSHNEDRRYRRREIKTGDTMFKADPRRRKPRTRGVQERPWTLGRFPPRIEKRLNVEASSG